VREEHVVLVNDAQFPLFGREGRDFPVFKEDLFLHPGVHADEGFKENALASSRLTEDTAVVPFFDFQRDMVRVGIAQKDR